MALKLDYYRILIGTIDDNYNTWKKVFDADPAGHKNAQNKMQEWAKARTKIMGLAQSRITAILNSGDRKKRLEVRKLTMNNYRKLSLEALDNIERDPSLKAKSDSLNKYTWNDFGQLASDVLDGKKNIEFATIVKTTLATSALALASQAGAFSAIGTAFTWLWATNPVIAGCAAVLGTAAVIHYAKKLFAPELKKISSMIKTGLAYNKETKEAAAQPDEEKNKFQAGDALDEFNESEVNRTTAGNLKKPDKKLYNDFLKGYKQVTTDILNQTNKPTAKGATYASEFKKKIDGFDYTTITGVDADSRIEELKTLFYAMHEFVAELEKKTKGLSSRRDRKNEMQQMMEDARLLDGDGKSKLEAVK